MRVSKWLVYCNGIVLTINAIMIWLIIAKAFPPMLGIMLVIAFLFGSVWLSCYANGMLPKQGRKTTFYSAPTERMRTL